MHQFTLMNYIFQPLLPVVLGHVPSGMSRNQLLHYGQSIFSGRFRQYDYGPVRNFIKYKRRTPPDYNLNNVRAPVAIYHSQNDWLATMKDTRILLKRLPNVVKNYIVPHEKFNHLDFIIGTQAKSLVYDELLKTMNSSILV